MNRRKWTLLLLASLAIAFCLATPVGAGSQGTEPRGLAVAKAAQERHTDDLLEIPGVVGTAIGLGHDGNAAIAIFTENHGVPRLPASLDGIPVKVYVTGQIFAQSAQSTDNRPARIGVSTGSERLYKYRGRWWCSSGTLGARVADDSNVYALSNNHVYAQENEGQKGDRILQPGRADMEGCGAADQIDDAVIGTLYSWVPIIFHRKANNTVDAAIALTGVDMVGTSTPDDGYGTPSATAVDAYLEQPVKKYGRTTGMTSGTVTGLNATVLVTYPSGTAKFINQIVIGGNSDSTFSDSGDSGSLIVDEKTNEPVALLFAGSGTFTIGNPIKEVLKAFGVSIDTN